MTGLLRENAHRAPPVPQGDEGEPTVATTGSATPARAAASVAEATPDDLAAREARRQPILRQVSELIARATDRRSAFRQISEIGLLLPGVESCGIQLWDASSGLVEVGYEVTIPAWPGTAEAGRLMTLAEAWPFPLLLHDDRPVHHWVGDPSLSDEDAAHLAREEVGSVLECPMLADGRLLGSLGFYARAQSPFPRATLELAAELATQTALVVRELMVREVSARISDERAMLLRVSTAANSSLDLDVVLGEVVQASVGVAGAERCRVDLLTTDGTALIVAAQASVPDWAFPPEDAVGQRLPIGEWSIDERVVTARSPFVVDGPEDPQVAGGMREDLERAGTNAILVCPLWVDDAFVGVVSTFSRRRGAFGPDELTLMGEVAQRTTSAIQNARLLSRERERADQQTALLRISRAATSSLDLYPILSEVCAACLGVEGTESAEVQLYDARHDEFEVAALASDPGSEHTVAPGARFAHGYWERIDPLITGQREPIVVVGEDAPLVCDNLRAKMTKDRIGSLLVMPLWHVGTCHGALVLFSRRTGTFSAEHLGLADQIARQAAIAIQNARLIENERRVARERALLLEITAAAGSDVTARDLLARIAEAGLSVPGTESCEIDLYDAGRRELEVGALVAVEGWTNAFRAEPGARYAIDHWVLDARAIAGDTPIVVDDLDHPLLDDTMRADCVAHDIRSLVFYPLRSRGQPLGIFTLISRRPNVFGADELALAGELAARAGSALEHALATERERRLAEQRGTLLRISAAATSSLDLATTLEEAAAELKLATGVGALTIELWRPELGVFEVALSLTDPGPIQAPAAGARFPGPDDAPSERMLATTTPFALDMGGDAARHPDLPPLRSRGAASIVCAPLWAADRCLGSIVLYDSRERLLDPALAELLEEAGGHIALAIANARLMEAERRRSLERSVLLEVGKAATADLSLDEKLNRIACACLVVPEVECATVTNFFPERGVTVTVTDVAVDDWPDVDPPGTTYRVADLPWLGAWLAEGRPVIHDVDDPACPPELRAEILGFGGQASLWVGLRLAGATIGGLAFHTRQRDALTAATVAIATEVAAQITLTIRNSRLFDETQRRAAEQAALLGTSQAATSSLDIDVMLTDATRALREVTRTEAIAVERWLPEDDAFQVVTRVSVWDWAAVDPPGTSYPRTSCDFYDRILARRGAWAVDAGDVPPGHPFLDDVARLGMRSVLLAPLWTQDSCLGVIVMYDRRPSYYTADMVQLTEQAAGQIALAMANVSLLARERQRADDRATLLRISQEVTAGTDVTTMLNAAAEALRVGTGFDLVEVERWRPELDLFELVGVSAGSASEPVDPIGLRTARGDFGVYDRILARTGAFSMVRAALPEGSVERAALERFDIETTALAPLTANDQVLGLVGLYRGGNHPVPERVLRLTEEAAGHIALAMANADLLEQERRQALEHTVMVEVGRAAMAPTSLEAKIREIAALCLELPEIDGATIEYWYPDRRLVEIIADATTPGWVDADEAGKRYPVTVDDWISGWRQGAGPLLLDTTDPELSPWIRDDILSYGAAASLWDGLELDPEVSVLIGFHTRTSGRLTAATSRFAATITAHTGLAIRNARLLAETQRHAEEQAALLRVSRAVTTVTPDTLADSLRQIAALSMNVVDADLCEILLWHRDVDATAMVAQVVSAAWAGAVEPMNVIVPLAGRSIALDVLHERRAVIVRDDASYPEAQRARLFGDGTRSGLIAPLVFGDRAIGMIGYYTARPDAFDEHDASLAVDLGGQTALAIERANTLAALSEQATTDGLTGLLNHRAVRDRLDLELLRAERREEAVAVCMVDLNRFKLINDTHGHLLGDEVLRQAAEIIKNATRQTDIVGRYGGDEFLVVLPETDAVTAVMVAERMLTEAAKTMIPLPGGGVLTPSLSIGFAVYPTDATSRPELLETADRAMYEAKAKTRRPVAHGTRPLHRGRLTAGGGALTERSAGPARA